MKVVTIVGARPQFIKAAVLSRVFIEKGIDEIIIHTGQHFDENMSEVFFKEMSIPFPHYNLNVNGLDHGAMTGKMLEGIEKILKIEKPDWVLVYGDTNSTIAGALAAKKLHFKVAHVEAGLRSFNMKMPEEINRILTDRISDILFCPTDSAIANLMAEGYSNFNSKVLNSGDVMLDAALFYKAKSKKPEFNIPNNYILATIHRAENTDDAENLNSIFKAFEVISETSPVVLPIHPRTRSKLKEFGYSVNSKNIYLIDPVGYFEMIWLISNSKLVMTDSGGLQKEAFFFSKLCVTLREETEWVELVHNGFNVLVGSSKDQIIAAVNNCLNKGKLESHISLYGEGKAGEIICDELLKNS